MANISRNGFLKICGGLALAPLASVAYPAKPKLPLLSFSTLGCPDWPLQQIIEFASANGYKGVEIRGIERELDLSKSKHFNSPAALADTVRRFRDKQIRIVGLGSSCELHHREAVQRQKNIDEAKQFIDIADKVNSPSVRVFPNSFPPGQERAETMDLISRGLDELAVYAKGSHVRILMETHGDLVKSEDLQHVMQAVNNSNNTGLIWDVSNMWTRTKEDPAIVYERIKKYIHHTHIKDLILADGKSKYTFLGKGEVPIFQAIDILMKNNYTGFFSFEWEKLWHPEIEASELALADYPVAMKNHFR